MDYKIVTHSGKAHLDEIFAIALLSIYKKRLPVRIKRVKHDLAAYYIKRGLIHKNIYFLDCGMGYNPKENIFDHHHKELPSAAYLIMEYYLPYLIDSDLGKYIKTLSDVDNYGPSILSDYSLTSDTFNFIKFPIQLILGLFDKEPLKVVEILVDAIKVEINSIELKKRAKEWLNSQGNYNIVKISNIKLLIYNYPPDSKISKYIKAMDYEIIDKHNIDVIYGFDPVDSRIRTLYRTTIGDKKVNFNNIKSIQPHFSHNNGFLFKFKPDSLIDISQIIDEASLLC